jgi:hypothetical protein
MHAEPQSQRGSQWRKPSRIKQPVGSNRKIQQGPVVPTYCLRQKCPKYHSTQTSRGTRPGTCSAVPRYREKELRSRPDSRATVPNTQLGANARAIPRSACNTVGFNYSGGRSTTPAKHVVRQMRSSIFRKSNSLRCMFSHSSCVAKPYYCEPGGMDGFIFCVW